MTQRTRKLYGTILLLLSIVVYAVVVTWVYMNLLPLTEGWQQIVFFAITGTLWFFPAAWIIRWMSAPDR